MQTLIFSLLPPISLADAVTTLFPSPGEVGPLGVAPLNAGKKSSAQSTLPELPGFDASSPVPGGLAAVADRMADALRDQGGQTPVVLGNGYGEFVALQMAIRHPGLVLADCGTCFSESGRQTFRAIATGVEAGGPAKIADVAMRRLFAPEFQDAHPDLMAERRAAFLRTAPDVLVAACHAWRRSTSGRKPGRFASRCS